MTAWHLSEVADADSCYVPIRFGPLVGLVVPEAVSHCKLTLDQVECGKHPSLRLRKRATTYFLHIAGKS